MQFDGQDLRSVIATTENTIELRDEYGRCRRTMSREEALALDLELFIGVGNRRRIRFLRLRTQHFTLNAGSRTTHRLKGRGGENISPPWVREHRQEQGTTL